MAWDPCVSCGSSFRGKTLFTYVSWFDGATRHSYRYRQCPECGADFRNDILEKGDARTAAGDWERSELNVQLAKSREVPHASRA